ncbi:folate/biopterin transporter [Gloeomargarita lithophora Alchichica-D10]|uniref:Folate/biopterin transporter n=1 Tax=Gloeomargarita lithophora Alchichica-D10 TaxID=1188229 RepID=A0A1J0AH45_9CYAN|nr:folate/biopterin family MFS transporter [Gloeomargarita lithophora]APB35266.1 folate/biopterin transporter [Gloeomargarita lithophora Alchichica-D10]
MQVMISPPWRAWVQRRLFLGWEPTPELLGILLVYFVQGVIGLARLAVSFFLKDELGLSPATVAALTGIAALPWMVKPLFGLIADGLPLWGYRRRSYLILSGILGAVAWGLLAVWVQKPWQAVTAITLASLATAMGDVIADSLVVERVRGATQSQTGSLQSLCWGTSAVGGLVTAYFSGALLQHLGTRAVFGITALFPMLVSLGAFWVQETQITAAGVVTQVQQVWQAMKQRAILLPTLFLFLWQATPNSDTAFFFFVTNELQFPPEFLGRVRLVTSVAALVGVWVFQRYLREVPIRRMLLWTTLLSSGLGLTSLLLVTHTNRLLGIPDRWFSLGDSAILTVMGELAFMPVLVLAARLCPAGIEATLFALLMSVLNLAGGVAHELGALLTHVLGITETHFDRLWLLVTITNLSTLLPLPLLNWLPEHTASSTPGVHLPPAVVPDAVVLGELAPGLHFEPVEVES